MSELLNPPEKNILEQRPSIYYFIPQLFYFFSTCMLAVICAISFSIPSWIFFLPAIPLLLWLMVKLLEWKGTYHILTEQQFVREVKTWWTFYTRKSEQTIPLNMIDNSDFKANLPEQVFHSGDLVIVTISKTRIILNDVHYPEFLVDRIRQYKQRPSVGEIRIIQLLTAIYDELKTLNTRIGPMEDTTPIPPYTEG